MGNGIILRIGFLSFICWPWPGPLALHAEKHPLAELDELFDAFFVCHPEKANKPSTAHKDTWHAA